jgi:hypothetical protein
MFWAAAGERHAKERKKMIPIQEIFWIKRNPPYEIYSELSLPSCFKARTGN